MLHTSFLWFLKYLDIPTENHHSALEENTLKRTYFGTDKNVRLVEVSVLVFDDIDIQVNVKLMVVIYPLLYSTNDLPKQSKDIIVPPKAEGLI